MQNIVEAYEQFRWIITGALRQYRHNDDNSGLIHKPEKGFAAGYDKDEADKAIGILESAISRPEPTHYAVIDEHGEIVLAHRLATFPDAEDICKRELSDIWPEIKQSKRWTVKGVTVHD